MKVINFAHKLTQNISRLSIYRTQEGSLTTKQLTTFISRVNFKSPGYSFSLKNDLEKGITCSFLPIDLYSYLSTKENPFPATLSKFHEQLYPILQNFEMAIDPIFIPINLEMDSRFIIIDDFVLINLVGFDRLNNFITEFLVNKIRFNNYSFILPLKNRIINILIYWLYKTRFRKILENIIQISELTPETPLNTIHGISMLMTAQAELFKKLSALNEKNFILTGWPLTRKEAFDALEKIFAADLKAYQANKSETIHSFFRPQ